MQLSKNSDGLLPLKFRPISTKFATINPLKFFRFRLCGRVFETNLLRGVSFTLLFSMNICEAFRFWNVFEERIFITVESLLLRTTSSKMSSSSIPFSDLVIVIGPLTSRVLN